MSTEGISIAIGYLNRLKLTAYTLSRIEKFGFKGEIVVADDHSNPEQRAELLIPMFPSLDIKVVYPEKNVINPAHTYNTAFSNCSRDIVIIQNAECVWVHDIASYTAQNLSRNDYFVFGCLNGSKEATANFDENTDLTSIVGAEGRFPWYQHSVHRNSCLHFCSAIYRDSLNSYLQGGFDERFNDGYCYDDNEFIFRVLKHLKLFQIDDLYVIHQYHERFWDNPQRDIQKIASLQKRNLELFQNTQATYGTPDYKGIFPKGEIIK